MNTTRQLADYFCDLAQPGLRELSPYRPGKPIDELQREMGIEEVVKLASNENPIGPGAAALHAINSQLADLARYPDGSGYTLKRALARHLSVREDMITLGNGSNDVLELLARAFVGSDDQVIYSKYAFAVYPLVARALNAISFVSRDNNFGHDLEAMRMAVTNRTRMIFIANPNNPTGTYLKADDLRAFIADLPKHVIVVLDEAYYEYAIEAKSDAVGYPKNSMAWIEDYPNLAVTRTFSKAYGLAGLRIGYCVSHPIVADLLTRIRQPFNTNQLAIVAAEAALKDKQHLQHSLHMNARGMQQLCSGVKQLGFDYIPSVGNFVAIRIGRQALAVYQALLEYGVIVRPLSAYEMPHYLRVSIGSPSEINTFLYAMKRVVSRLNSVPA